MRSVAIRHSRIEEIPRKYEKAIDTAEDALRFHDEGNWYGFR